MNAAIGFAFGYIMIAVIVYYILTGGTKATDPITAAFHMLFGFISMLWPIALPVLLIWILQSWVKNKFK